MPNGYVDEVYKSYSSSKHRLGAVIDMPDGRRFRHALNGATALVAGKVVQMPVPAANHLNIAVAAAAAVGDKRVSVTLGATAAAADLYKDGYVYVNDVDGEGHYYRIKGHLAIASAGTGWINLYEDSVIAKALTTSSEVTLIRNPFAAVIIHPSPPTAKCVGVPIVDVPANYYCWLQTRGFAAVLTDTTVLISDLCVPSANVNGAVMPSAAIETDGPVVGEVIAVNADTEYSAINLRLE